MLAFRSSAFCWLSLSLLLVAPASFAAPPKASAEKGVTARKVTPDKGGRSDPKKKASDLPAAARLLAEEMLRTRLGEDLATIGKLRTEAKKLLSDFIRDEDRVSPDLPEAYLKLAELEYEGLKEDHQKAFVAWEAKPVVGRGAAPNLELKWARGYVKEVLERFPSYREYDLALYLDAALAGEEGDDKSAVARFKVILERYPKSRFQPDAHMAIGESLFNATFGGGPQWTSALAEYEQVLKYSASDLYGLAMFKSAWCLWKIGKQDEAAKRFTKVLEVTSAKAGASIAKRKALESLEDEAIRALVDVFVADEGTSAEDVYNFLVRIGGDRFAGKIVRRLATAYEDAARYKKVVEAYELLRRLEPTSPDGTEHVLSIAKAWAIEADETKLLATYTRLLEDHLPEGPSPTGKGKTSATWAKTQLDPELLKKSTTKIEDDLRARALEAHARGQTTGNKNDFQLAVKLYQLYLTRFRESTNAYDVLFYAAEIEFHRLGLESDAARDYLACAKLNPKGGLSKDALFNALTALDRLRTKELEATKGKPTKGEESETDKRFAEALSFYAATYPNDPEIPGFLLSQGITYYDFKVYDPAIKIFGELLTRYPTSKEAGGAGERMLDSLVHAKDFGNVETWGRKLKVLPAFSSDAQQKRLDGLIVQAVFKQGEGLLAKGDFLLAANAYLRAAKEFPKDERASKACVNAIIAAKKAGELGVAQEAADLALNQHKGSPEAPLAAFTVAEALRSASLLGDAAAYDERLVREYPKDAKAREASFNAVVIRVALGDYDFSVKDGNEYLRLFASASADDADEVTFLLGQAHEKAKKYADAAKVYVGYVLKARNTDHKIEALVRLAQVRVLMGETKAADDALKQAIVVYNGAKGLKEGRVHAAHARYLQGERIVTAYDAVTLDAQGDELRKRLDKKKNLLKEAGTIFGDCAKMGAGEWTTAALYRIGYIFEGFAQGLKSAKPPSTSTPEQVEAFRNIVDPIAEQFVEKAIDAYENGWKKAVELKIFNRWTAEMRAALAKLNDVEYPPLREVGVEVRSTGPVSLPEAMDAPAIPSKPAVPAPTTPKTPAPAAPAIPAKAGKK